MPKPAEAPAEVTSPKGLHAKLAQAASQLGWLEKTGTNQHFKYNFAEASHVVASIREVLLPLGVAFHADCLGATRIPCGSQVLTQVQMKYTLVDGESGERWESSWMGEGADAADKGLNKAYTAAIKYWAIQTFLLPLGDDPEADDATDKAAHNAALVQAQMRPGTLPPAEHSGMAGLAQPPQRSNWSGKPAAPKEPASVVAGNGKPASTAQVKYLWALTARKLGVSGSADIKAAIRARFGITDLAAVSAADVKRAIDSLVPMPDFGAAAEPVAAAVSDEPPPPTDADWDFGRDQ